MKTKTILLMLTGLITVTALIFQACKKDEKDPNPNTPPTYTNGEGDIGPLGGTVTINNSSSELNGVKIIIPENALSNTEKIKISSPPDSISFPGDPDAFIVAFEPEGLLFNDEIIIELPIPASMDTFLLQAYYLDYENDLIKQIPREIDYQNKKVKITTNHFSYFAISQRGVHANVDLFYSNKLTVNVFVEGWAYGKNYGFQGVPTKIWSWPFGIYNLKSANCFQS